MGAEQAIAVLLNWLRYFSWYEVRSGFGSDPLIVHWIAVVVVASEGRIHLAKLLATPVLLSIHSVRASAVYTTASSIHDHGLAS